MKFKNLTFQLLILSLLSCADNRDIFEKTTFEGEELWLKNFFYSDGSLEGQQTYMKINQDSFIGHGYSKSFYPSGRIKNFTRLDNGNKIGTTTKYFESGQIKEIWFYNPVGKALYSRGYNENGEMINEQMVNQRIPQVIYKTNEKGLIEFKVYSVNIPERKKNVYFINDKLEVIDSVLNSKLPFDVFKFNSDCKQYQINVDYYDVKSGAYIETDNLQFSVED